MSIISLEQAVLWGLAFHGLETASRHQLQLTVEKLCPAPLRELEVVLGNLRRTHALHVTDRELRWSPLPLHLATLDLVDKHPRLIQTELGRLSSWGIGGGENRIRLAVYCNKPDMIESAQPHTSDWATRYWLPAWDDEFFCTRHPSLQQRMLPSLRYGLWTHGVWSVALGDALTHSENREMQLELAMAQNRLEQCVLHANTRRKGYDAVLTFLKGDPAAAYERIAKMMAWRKAAMEPFVSVFARMAALRVGDLDALSDPRFKVFPGLDGFFSNLARCLKGGPPPPLPDGDGLPWCIVWSLRACLPDVRVRPKALVRLAESGLQGWLEQLDEHPGHPWAASVVCKEPWRIWLESVRQKATLPVAPAASPGGYSVAWQVGSLSLRAFRQEAGKVGLELQLANLIASPPEYLSESDHAVLNKIERRHWGTAVDIVNVSPAVRALIGTSHVLFEGEPAQLVEAPQKLSLQRTGQGYRLELKPKFRNANDFRCRRVDGNRVEVCFPSTCDAALSPLLEEGHVVPFEAEEALRECLAPWMDRLEIDYGEGVKPLTERVEGGRLVARLVPQRAGMRLSWTWAVSPQGPFLPAFDGPAREVVRWQGKLIQVERDLEQERRQFEAYAELAPGLPGEQDAQINTLENALDVLHLLQQAGVPTEWPEGGGWKVRRAATRQPSVRVNSTGDWFEVRGKLRVDESTVVELARLLTLMREYPGRYVPLAEGDYLEIGEQLRQKLQSLDDLVEDHKSGALRLSPLAAPGLANLDLKLKGDATFQETLERFEQAALHCPAVPASLQADLRDYQVEGYQWLSQRARAGVGACLADDMGLGKTMQVLALMLEIPGPHLVVCPVSVTANWRDQIHQFAPGLRPQLYEGKERQLEDLGDVVICSYRIMLQDVEELGKIGWSIALLDEAQFIKNPQSQTALASFTLNASVRLATTGTPVENRAAELWSIFRFLNPGLLGGLTSFRRRFEGANRASQRQLKRLVAPFLLRRTKAQVLSELPSRTEIQLAVDLSAGERALYEVERREANEKLEQPGGTFQTLAYLTRLRQACCHPRLLLDQSDLSSAKFEAFFELLEDLRAGRHRCLVFSQFTKLLDLLEAELRVRELVYLRLDGSTPVAERRRRVQAFQGGEGELFLISLKAGGTGLNLTAADYVVHLDPWWNPASEDQASDRAHRLGQTRPVTIYRLIARDTVEEKVVHLHGQKRQLAQDLLAGRERPEPLSAHEIRQLLL